MTKVYYKQLSTVFFSRIPSCPTKSEPTYSGDNHVLFAFSDLGSTWKYLVRAFPTTAPWNTSAPPASAPKNKQHLFTSLYVTEWA